MNSVLCRRMPSAFGIRVLITFFFFSTILSAQDISQKTIKETALDVAGQQGSALIKTHRIVDWMHNSFEWSYTDYQNRSVREIIQL